MANGIYSATKPWHNNMKQELAMFLNFSWGPFLYPDHASDPRMASKRSSGTQQAKVLQQKVALLV